MLDTLTLEQWAESVALGGFDDGTGRKMMTGRIAHLMAGEMKRRHLSLEKCTYALINEAVDRLMARTTGVPPDS